MVPSAQRILLTLLSALLLALFDLGKSVTDSQAFDVTDFLSV